MATTARDEELRQLLSEVRASQRDFTPEDLARALDYQRELVWRKFRESYETLERRGLLGYPGYVPREEARRRLEAVLTLVDTLAQERGRDISWTAAMVEGVLESSFTKELHLRHLEWTLQSPKSVKRDDLRVPHHTPLLEFLQVALPEDDPLDAFLQRHEAQAQDTKFWSVLEAHEHLGLLLAKTQEGEGAAWLQRAGKGQSGARTASGLMNRLETARVRVVHAQLLQKALTSPAVTLRETLLLVDGIHPGKFNILERTDGQARSASNDLAALALSALREAGGLRAVVSFLEAYDTYDAQGTWRLPGVDAALNFALHYEDLKDQSPAVREAMLPTREAVVAELYGEGL